MPENALSDSIIEFTTYKSRNDYPKQLRRVECFDKDNNRLLVFLTNGYYIVGDRFSLQRPLLVRRTVLQMVKQHLKIKKFWGDSENVVRIQIYTAIISYCLVAVVHHKMKLKISVYNALQGLGISLTDTAPIDDLFNKFDLNIDKELDGFYEPMLFDV